MIGTQDFETALNDLPKATKTSYCMDDIVNVLKDNYYSLFAQKDVLLLVVNEDHRIEFISHSLCDVLHYPKQSLVNESIFSILDDVSIERVKVLTKSLKNKFGKMRRIHNLVLYCVYNVDHYFDGLVINLVNDKRINGYLFYLHNVSEHRRVENQLKDLNLELDSFVYKASHDLRAPLTSLAGLINLTEMDFPPQAAENFNLMKVSVHKLDKFIRQLASYSRNNNTESESVEINFHSLINELLDGFKHLVNVDKINFLVEINVSQLMVSDVFRLQVILSNLISNAIKYHQPQQDFPFIKISVEVIEAKLFLTVKDNGIGIGEEYIDKIFDMFMRANDYSDGSGLGLYIVKKALEKLNGKIEVKSKRGEGSTFTVALPLMTKKRGTI